MNNYIFDEISIGMQEKFRIVITKAMEDSFREITGDVNPLHYDDGFARTVAEGKYKSHVSFGMLTASLYSTLAGVYLPGKYSLIHSVEVKFLNPVFIGDELEISGIVSEKQEALHLLRIKAKIENQDSRCVSKANMKVLVLK